jgi:hypothetical protein
MNDPTYEGKMKISDQTKIDRIKQMKRISNRNECMTGIGGRLIANYLVKIQETMLHLAQFESHHVVP